MSNKRSDEIEERKRGCGGQQLHKECSSWPSRASVQSPSAGGRWQREMTGRSGSRLLDTGRDSLDITAEAVCNRWKIQIPTFPTITQAVMSALIGQSPRQQVPHTTSTHTTCPHIPWKFLGARCAMYGVHARNTRRNRNHGRLLDTATRACGRVLEQLPMAQSALLRTVSNPVQSVFRLTLSSAYRPMSVVSAQHLVKLTCHAEPCFWAIFSASTTTPQPATTQPNASAVPVRAHCPPHEHSPVRATTRRQRKRFSYPAAALHLRWNAQ